MTDKWEAANKFSAHPGAESEGCSQPLLKFFGEQWPVSSIKIGAPGSIAKLAAIRMDCNVDTSTFLIRRSPEFFGTQVIDHLRYAHRITADHEVVEAIMRRFYLCLRACFSAAARAGCQYSHVC